MEQIRRVPEVRRWQCAGIIVARQPLGMQGEEERFVKRRDDHSPPGTKFEHVVCPVHQHLAHTSIAKGEPRVPASRHVLEQRLHRRARRPAWRQERRVRAPERHAVRLQQRTHVVALLVRLLPT